MYPQQCRPLWISPCNADWPICYCWALHCWLWNRAYGTSCTGRLYLWLSRPRVSFCCVLHLANRFVPALVPVLQHHPGWLSRQHTGQRVQAASVQEQAACKFMPMTTLTFPQLGLWWLWLKKILCLACADCVLSLLFVCQFGVAVVQDVWTRLLVCAQAVCLKQYPSATHLHCECCCSAYRLIGTWCC